MEALLPTSKRDSEGELAALRPPSIHHRPFPHPHPPYLPSPYPHLSCGVYRDFGNGLVVVAWWWRLPTPPRPPPRLLHLLYRPQEGGEREEGEGWGEKGEGEGG